MSDTMTDEFRNSIRKVKSELKSSGVDVAAAFARIDEIVEAQIRQIETEREAGISPVPECDFAEVAAGSVSDHLIDSIKRRGAVVIRNTFDRDLVASWNDRLMDYVARNDFYERQKAKQGMDQYFASLSSSRPQILGLYWSRPQMEARTSSELAVARRWLNRLWKFSSDNGLEFDPDRECLYADRLRQREPGDDTLGLSAHVDGGSVERWLDEGFRGVYRHLLSGDVESYDPFDAAYRTVTVEIPSPAVCSMFRTYQGWTALSRQGPGDGTLNLVPVANAMAWVILRALQDDVPDDELCGAAPSRALYINDTWHQKILRAYVPIPIVEPGDTVWWHPDVIHGVEDQHTGTGYSNVMYIGAAPACAKNERFLAKQRRAFEAGESSPDFAAENYEVDFEDRFTADMLSPLGRAQMGYGG